MSTIQNISLSTAELNPLPDVPEDVKKLLEEGVLEDLTERIRNCQVKCFGRDSVIEWIADHVPTSKSNAMLLTGNPGIGKTVVIDYLAHVILHKKMFGLTNRRVFILKKSPVRALEILNNQYRDSCIVVCDEFHALISSGPSSNTQQSSDTKKDSPDDIKKVIDGTQVPFIGLTDRPSLFLTDAAWRRRLQLLSLTEMDVNSACELLFPFMEDIANVAQNTLKAHLGENSIIPTISIDKKALDMAVKLSSVLLREFQLPGKVFSILEPAVFSFIRSVISDHAKKKTSLPESIVITAEDVLKKCQEAPFNKTKDELNLLLKEAEIKALSPPIPGTLSLCTNNLAVHARMGLLEKIQERDLEVSKTLNSLARPKLNSVLLKGKAGVGKTAFVNHLAIMIDEGTVPDCLKNKQILSLNVNDLIEALSSKISINDFTKDLEDHGHRFIFFIDEMHIFLNAKVNDNPLVDFFKDYICNGKLSIIGTSTPQDLDKVSSFKEESIQSRFEIVELLELSYTDSVKLIEESEESIIKNYSEHFSKNFKFEKGTWNSAVKSATFYLPDEARPRSVHKIVEGTAVDVVKNNPGHSEVTMSAKDIEEHCRKNYRKGLFDRAWKVLNNKYQKCSKISTVAVSAFYTLIFVFSIYNQFTSWINPRL